MVYDGSYTQAPSLPIHATIVGFSIIQIDGYSSSVPGTGTLYEPNMPSLRIQGTPNTMYGHAVADILEPASGQITKQDIMDYIKKNFGAPPVRLVDPDLKYGVITH